MDIATCPRCHQKINPQALTCPHCRTQLKAYGHPGIPLYRATGDKYLCDSCIYDADDTCNFPQRPHAQECTLYQNIEETKLELQRQHQAQTFTNQFRSWVKRNQSLLLILALFFLCLLIVVATS